MGTYNIPRNVKGEGRILFVFSTKSLLYSIVGIIIGLPIYLIMAVFNLKIVGFIILAILTLTGFAIATFKIPEISGLKFTKTIGGSNIDDIIKRVIKFKKDGNKIYLYTKEEKNG